MPGNIARIHKFIYIMFILRSILSENIEHNICIGSSYNKVEKESNPTEFERAMKVFHPDDFPGFENIYCFIIYELGSQILPMYKGFRYYIMTSDGATFDNASFK